MSTATRHVIASIATSLVLALGQEARSDVIVFETSTFCEFSLNKVVITRATIIGHRSSIVALLERSAVFHLHDCSFLLDANPERLSEVEWAVKRHAKPIEPGDARASAPEKVVRLKIDNPSEFVGVAKSLRSGGGGPPAPPLQGKRDKSGDGPSDPSKEFICEGGGELCLSDQGEMSMEMSCGGFLVGMSTDGSVTVGVSKGGVEASLSFGGP
jgi:hypothetical protein